MAHPVVALHHLTRYAYQRPVQLAPQVVRLRPAPHARTPVSGYAMTVEPAEHFLHWLQDPFANFLARLVFAGKTDELRVTVDLVAELRPVNPFDFFVEPYAERYPFDYEPGLKQDLSPYLEVAPASPRLRSLLDELERTHGSTVGWLVGLNQAIYERVAYVTREEPGVYAPEQTLSAGRGSCRDSGWLLVNALRHMGVAARFVSGYLIQLKGEAGDDGAAADPSAPAHDTAALHAWAEAYIPGAGWIGLDPTSSLLTGEGHIPLAAAPRPDAVSPIEGGVEPCDSELSHEMRLTRLDAAPERETGV